MILSWIRSLGIWELKVGFGVSFFLLFYGYVKGIPFFEMMCKDLERLENWIKE